MTEDLKIALTSPQEMDAYLEVRTGQEIIDHINELVAELQYEAGMYKSLYEAAVEAQLAASLNFHKALLATEP